MKIAIVGAGYSGTMAAVEAARAMPGAEIALVDRRGTFAAGAAYSTTSSSHLLNVRARGMSAFAADPDHFVRWVEAEGLGGADTFVPRRDYRRYLESVLAAVPGVRRVAGEAVAVEDGALVLADGTRLAFDALILAGGNYGGRLPARVEVPAVDDPWSREGTEAIRAMAGQKKDVLLVGTGLTMVDVALTLVDEGYGGRMVAVSRRGLLPRPHEEPASPPYAVEAAPRLGDLVRQVRAGAPWRAAVDSLRPHSQNLWRGFSMDEKKRFLRHLRPWWDVHRHRIAPPVARRIEALIAEGRLEVLAGRIRGGDAESVTVALRGGGERRFAVAGAINCTGPEGAIARIGDPLIRQLLEAGLARPDALGLGLDVDEAHRVIGAGGAASDRIYAVGPLTKGALWEIVAVPDIRHQVRDVALSLAG